MINNAFQNFQSMQETKDGLSQLIRALEADKTQFVKEVLWLTRSSVIQLPFNTENYTQAFNLAEFDAKQYFWFCSETVLVVNEPFDFQFGVRGPFIADEYISLDMFFHIVVSRLILTMLHWNEQQVSLYFDAENENIVFTQDASQYICDGSTAEDVAENWQAACVKFDSSDRRFFTNIYGHRVPTFEDEHLISKILDNMGIKAVFNFIDGHNRIVLELPKC